MLLELTDIPVHFNGLISGLAGFTLAILSLFVYTLGYVCFSLIQSIFITSCVLYAVNLFVYVDIIYIAPCIGVSIWVMLFVLNIRWKRAVSLIFITSYGVILIMLAIDFYLDLSLLRITAYRHLLARKLDFKPCWFSWVLLGLWPILLFLGSLVQFLKTAKNYDHQNGKFQFLFTFFLYMTLRKEAGCFLASYIFLLYSYFVWFILCMMSLNMWLFLIF